MRYSAADLRSEDRRRAPAPTPVRVLVIDDDLDLLEVLDQLLVAGGFEVLCASNGYAAKLAAGDYYPDVVLVDINMPECDGFEVLRRIRSRDNSKKIPVVAMTALDIVALRELGDTSKFTRIEQKPLDYGTLTLMLTRLARDSGLWSRTASGSETP